MYLYISEKKSNRKKNQACPTKSEVKLKELKASIKELK